MGDIILIWVVFFLEFFKEGVFVGFKDFVLCILDLLGLIFIVLICSCLRGVVFLIFIIVFLFVDDKDFFEVFLL